MTKTDHLKDAILHLSRARTAFKEAGEFSLQATCDETISDAQAAIKAEKRAVDALQGEARG